MSLAKRLELLEFQTPLTEEEQAKCSMMWANGGRVKGAAMIPKNGTWYIQFGFNGAVRTLGRAAKRFQLGLPTAARFSDMARQYFSKYRYPGSGFELNFSRARVTDDLKRELVFVHLLQDMEQYLLNTGAIHVPTDEERAKLEIQKHEPAIKLLDVYATVKQVGARQLQADARQIAMAATLTQLTTAAQPTQPGGWLADVATQLTELRKQQSVIIQILDVVAKRLNSTLTGSAPVVIPGNTCCDSPLGIVKV